VILQTNVASNKTATSHQHHFRVDVKISVQTKHPAPPYCIEIGSSFFQRSR
jgi:hypothetical protein